MVKTNVIIHSGEIAMQYSNQRTEGKENVRPKLGNQQRQRRPTDSDGKEINLDYWYEFTSTHSLHWLYQDAANIVTMNGIYLKTNVECLHIDIPTINRYVIIIFGEGLAEGPNAELLTLCAPHSNLAIFAKRSLIASQN